MGTFEETITCTRAKINQLFFLRGKTGKHLKLLRSCNKHFLLFSVPGRRHDQKGKITTHALVRPILIEEIDAQQGGVLCLGYEFMN